VVPVHYVLLRDSIVFRSDQGTKLRLLLTEPICSGSKKPHL
jgi:hypothetical protein